jgi:hypothetical protein
LIVILNAWVTVAPEVSLTWTVKLEVCKIVGVPVIWAEVLVLVDRNVKPAGRLPETTVHVSGGVAPEAFTNAL